MASQEPRRGVLSPNCGNTRTDDTWNVGANLPNPEGPSIAVLPFENISADPEQDYFADAAWSRKSQ